MTTPQPFTPPHPLNTAVLFLVFNRLDTTKQVFEAIRQAKPPRLYIAADGARETKEGEAEKVQAVREYVMENIDWDCEVKTLFREKNLGCKYAVSGAITWFFENEEQGIILEDDCLPSQSFFWYCESLLNHYGEEKRVFSISGNLRENYEVLSGGGVYRSHFFNMWGWATWRHQWQKYSVDFFDLEGDEFLKNYSFLNYRGGLRYWIDILNKMKGASINTWDYQAMFLSFSESLYNLYPSVNLVKNLGFGEDATHTFDSKSLASRIGNSDFILTEPLILLDEMVLIDDIFYDEYSVKSYLYRVVRRLKRVLRF
ncbi:hypothetical protein [Pseudomonas wenzhouensis]|uniref:hypothetical protein n=1 Tax=Pseudomonas wenzhouensis TaxID=2906062 RepID=UPI001E5A45C1|nr:hypothetical protein [Pseudomonas wenzhouensis]UFQ99155.1 hypothetical protein J7655_08255 [Pseudomonas wenzhouensis]